MSLDEYLKAHNLTDEEFGERIKRSRMQVFRYRNGRQIPRPAVMKRISEVTGGAVTANSFYGGGA